MATKIRWALMVVVVLVGSRGFARGVDIEPLVIGEVKYRAENLQARVEAPLEGWIQAVDLKNSAELWRVRLYEGFSRAEWLQGPKNPKIVSIDGFGCGLVAKTDDGATFFVNLSTHKAELVRDLRRTETECPVHHRPLVGVLAPIHYGMCRGNPVPNGNRDKPPLVINAGCCVMPEKTAILTICPDCS